MKLKRVLQLDWDAIAGIIAAVVALIMHLLHVIDVDVLLSIALVLMALLFIRDLRRERDAERVGARVRGIQEGISAIRASLHLPDVVLVGPLALRKVSRRFSERALGQMTWFHVCLSMFRTQALFDTLLKPAVDNPGVSEICFTLDPSQKELWRTDVLPKLQACRGASKVRADEPMVIVRPDQSLQPMGRGAASFPPGALRAAARG
ncbi:MAG TPA: hypothetical protein VFY71_18400 [Planctomycetota bacterium]|nr:hypothetical protein [Planctomycetota bacterium]